jgi:hypothetical protein
LRQAQEARIFITKKEEPGPAKKYTYKYLLPHCELIKPCSGKVKTKHQPLNKEMGNTTLQEQ